MAPSRTDHNQEAHYEPESILAELEWVRRLARRLCGDDATADDVCQDAMVLAWKAPPRRDLPLRGWLTEVVRRMAWQLHRKERRRGLREGAVAERLAESGHEPAAVDVVSRVTMQQSVVEAVLGLAEPYRTTLLRRYVDDLTPTEIAEQSEVPVATVKTRLRRGLAMLREHFDRTAKGGRQEWLAAFALLTMDLPTTATTIAAGVPVTEKVGFAGLSALAAATGFLLSLGLVAVVLLIGPDMSDPGVTAGLPDIDHPRGPVAVAGSDPPRVDRRAATSESGRPESAGRGAGENEPVRLLALRIRVVDCRARPVAGIRVVTAPWRLGPRSARDEGAQRVIGTTDAEGFVEGEVSRWGGVRLTVASEEHVAVHEPSVADIGGKVHATIVVSSPRVVRGVVVDPQGTVIPGAEVRYTTTWDPRTVVTSSLDIDFTRAWTTHADASGAFVFERVPAIEPASVQGRLVGYEDGLAALATTDADEFVTIEMREIADGSNLVRGRVVGPMGGPVEGALVSLGGPSVRTGADGLFQIEAQSAVDGHRLLAVAPGYVPAARERAPGEEWPGFVDLRLGGLPLDVAGRVVDARGRPVEGVTVVLVDPTTFGTLEIGPSNWIGVSAEDLAAGRELGALPVQSGVDGRFELRGLSDRTYTVRADDTMSLRTSLPTVVAAGAREVELRLVSGRLVDVAGLVTDPSGSPLVRAMVTARREIPGQPDAPGHGVAVRRSFVQGPTVRTDADGRFSFPSGIDPEGLHLDVFAGSFREMLRARVRSGDDPGDVHLVVRANVEFFLRVDPAHGAEAFRLEDARGNPVPLMISSAQGILNSDRGAVRNDRTPVYRAPEGLHTVVLSGREGEITRVPITLRATPATGRGEAVAIDV